MIAAASKPPPTDFEPKKQALAKIGLYFDTEKEFEEWRKWKNDDLQLERRIKNALYNL